MTTPPEFLVIDDDAGIRHLVERTFLQRGYRVRLADGAADGFSQVQRQEPDLVLLDVLMPDSNGLEVCRGIRAISSVPIILLTGLRNEVDIVAGLQAGADDYVTKPFSPRDQLARAEANLRRRKLDTTAARPAQVELEEGRFALDFDARSVRVGRTEVPLTPREFAILGYLALHAGRVVPHDELIQHVWGQSDANRLADVRTYVKLIRRKIEPNPSKPRYLQSRAGAGYIVPKT